MTSAYDGRAIANFVLDYAVDPWLIYTKLGGGWTKTNLLLQSPVVGVLATNDKTNSGWLVGFGVEYA